jgi:hypothetical protein
MYLFHYTLRVVICNSYQINSVLDKITEVSFNQNAAKLRDKWLLWWLEKIYGKRVQSNVVFLKRQYGEKLPADYSKEENLPSIIIKKFALYFDFMGILMLKFLVFQTIGIFKPI